MASLTTSKTNTVILTQQEIADLIRAETKKAIAEEKRIWQEEMWKNIDRGHFERQEENYKVGFGLNAKGPQLKSKTEKAIRCIIKIHNTHKINYPSQKMVTIVFTNNSLLEGAQWQSRTAAKFEGHDIICQRLASDSIEKEKDFSKASQLMSAFFTYAGKTSKTHLGDVIIMCNHPTRINDVAQLIDVCAGNGRSERTGTEFIFNIFFDEYDKPKLRGLMMNFIKEMYTKRLTYLINHIQLISGTNPPDIIRELKEFAPEAARMLNIQKQYAEDGDALSNYRTILEQEFIPQEGPTDPIDYVKNIDISIFVPGKIYFIPSHWYTCEQEKMAELKIFKEKGYWICIINGKNKELRSPLGEIQKINLKQRDSNGNRQELYHILSRWRRENPYAGLVITGNDCIERGLTFLTKGFNFDYMIISNYFGKDLYKLVQIGGRGQGQTEYVDDFKIIMPQALYDRVKKYIEDDEKLTNAQHDYYDEDLLASVGKIDPYANIEEPHYESTIEELSEWIHNNIKLKNGKAATVQTLKWLSKKKNKDGFIMHKFGGTKENPSPPKVWSEEEALQQRGGMAAYSRRIFPCYVDVKDVNTLRWYVFYRNA